MTHLYSLDNCFNFITYFDELTSTNDYIIDLYKKSGFKNTLTVIAKQQVQGRGRMGKIWFSDNGKGLTFSFSVKLNSKINLFDINMITTFSIIHLLRGMNIFASIKYPNDIIYKKKKIAGVLIESIKISGDSYCVIGVGLNVNNELFPKNIPASTSLYKITSNFFDINRLFQLLLVRLQESMHFYLNDQVGLRKSYFSVLWGTEEYVPCLFKDKQIIVKILSITKQGFLSILTKDSVVNTVNAKDLKFLLS